MSGAAAERGRSRSGDFAVVVVNYGDPALLRDNFAPDFAHDANSTVVVVDNYHSDRTRELTEKLCVERDWLCVASPNDGFGAGVNRGVAAARALGIESFVTLNPDARATGSTLRALADQVRADPCVLVAPYLESSDGRPQFRGAMVSMRTGRMRSGWGAHDDDPEWKNWLSGACLAFSAEAFRRVGGFREDFFLYWEDVDISRRAAALGLRLVVRPDLVVVHDEGGTQDSQQSRAKSSTYYYYDIRNRMLFGRGQLTGVRWARWVLAAPRESAMIWMRGGRRQAVTEPRGVWCAARGFVAGMGYAFRRPTGTP